MCGSKDIKIFFTHLSIQFVYHKWQDFQAKSGGWPSFTSMYSCKRFWKLPYTRLRRPSAVATTSSSIACLSSWIVIIHLRNIRSLNGLHKKKSPSLPTTTNSYRDGALFIFEMFQILMWFYAMRVRQLPQAFGRTNCLLMILRLTGAIFLLW